MRIRAFFLLALPLLAACPSISGIDNDMERNPGIIRSPYLQGPALVAPTVVTAGQAFTVTVTTLGFSGCWRRDGDDVVQAAASATIRPFDRVEGEVCTAALVNIRRTVELRFDTPGTARIVVEGRGDPNEPQPGPLTIEQTVTVQ